MLVYQKLWSHNVPVAELWYGQVDGSLAHFLLFYPLPADDLKNI